ncbi:hypothetical protein MKW92_051736 [Papaver armeniacum]|nr:hypothetical protein MKW92_051736 [Papaver armeniacum]
MERGLETRETMSTKEEVEEDKEEEEEEDKICRICHSPGDSENPLQYPCACSGSMKFVHPKCLLHWMKQRITFECEVCKHKFSVYRVYAENTPTRLPLREFVGGISVKACLVLRFCVRFCFSVFHQHLMVPLLAFWMWRLSLVSSLSEAKELFVHSHVSPSTAIMDWLYGIVICHVIYMIEDEEHGEVEVEVEDHVAIAPAPGNENDHIADEIGENAGEPQAIASVRNDNNFAPGLRLLVWWLKLLVGRLRRYLRRLMINSFRLDVPLRRTGIYMVLSILYGRIILHCLSWLFFVASSIFMPFIESALYIENNSLKNASHAVTNLSVEIQNNGMLSCAVEVVAETLTADSTGAGEAISSLYYVTTLATGYVVVVPLVFVCLGIPIRTVALKIRYYLRKFLTTTIHSFVLIIHLGVIPLVYGWWLDVCTITMLGKSISDRVEFFSKFPLLSSSLHWVIGIIYMCQINISISQVRRVLRRGVLCFLHDLADPIDIILGVLIDEVQVSQLFSIAVNGILIVFLVYFPGVLAMRLAPTIFPLHISVPDPFIEIPVVILLLQICLPYAIELWGTVEALLHQWVTAVCCFLGLSGFLSSRPKDIGGQGNVKVERRQDRLRDGLIAAQDPNKNIVTSQNFDGVENYASDAIVNGYTFVLRVVLLIVLAWITLLLFNSSMIIVSLQLGRAVFSFISNLPITHGIKGNDLYAFFIGNFSIWTSITGARYFMEHFKAGKAHLRFSNICKLLCLIAELCSIITLVTDPDHYETVNVSLFSLCYCQMDSPLAWVLGHSELYCLSLFTWLACATIIVLFSCAKRFPVWIINLHNSMRDDRYSGLGLQNFGETASECQKEI